MAQPTTIAQPRRWRGGLEDDTAAGWAGFAAGAVYLLAQVMLVTLVRHDSAWLPLQRISALLLGPDALLPPGKVSVSIVGFALLIHFPLAFCYGRLIGRALRSALRAPDWLVGAGCGLVIYLLNYHVLGALAFPWFAQSQGAVTAVDHVLFGVVAARVFMVLRRGSAAGPSTR